jgi:hypothetical protein
MGPGGRTEGQGDAGKRVFLDICIKIVKIDKIGEL